MTRSRILTIIAVIVAVILVPLMLLIFSYAKWQVFDVSEHLSPSLVSQLDSLGKEALSTQDVPVSSLLLYKEQVIGKGYNTVNRTGSVGAHAEINAISDAIQRLGNESFSTLDRDSLVLISTFEPCPMCRGAILEYRIHHVQFLKPKPITYLLLEDLRAVRYEWERSHREPSSLQDSLFSLHPAFKKPN